MRSTIAVEPENSQTAAIVGGLSSQELFRLAGEHNVLWPLADFAVQAFGKDAFDPFLVALYGDIRSRSAAIARQLEETVAALSEAGRVMLLKGACFIGEDGYRPQPWRHMVDLDLLLAPDASLSGAAEILKQAGYLPKHAEGFYDPALHNHYPPLSRPDRPVGIELHRRCVREPCGELLEVGGLWQRAAPIDHPLAPALLPSANDRMIHLIVHAQIGSHFYRRRLFHLRDAVDFLLLAQRPDLDLGSVAESFAGAGRRHEFLSFARMAERIWDRQFLPPPSYAPRHDKWVESALKNLADPGNANRYIVYDLLLRSAQTTLRPSRWPILIAQLKPDRMRDYLRRLRRDMGG